MKLKFDQIVKGVTALASSGIIVAGVPKLYNFIKNLNITQIEIIAATVVTVVVLICATFITNSIVQAKKEITIVQNSNSTQLQATKTHEENKTKRTELSLNNTQKNFSPNNPPPTPSTSSANAVGYTNTDARAENDIEQDEQNSSAQQRKSKVIPLSSFNSYKKGATKN